MREKNKPSKYSHQRDSEATKKRILEAAKQEFASHGLSGARVDVIAEKAEANKRMIYHYFGNKEELFTVVLEDAYIDIRSEEKELHLEKLDPETALKTLVEFTWNYYLKNPTFLRIINSENLHQARHLKESSVIDDLRGPFVGMIDDILKRGEKENVFRKNVDTIQLIITIASVGYYYFTNRYTGSILFSKDFMSQEALDERLAFNIETILRLVKK